MSYGIGGCCPQCGGEPLTAGFAHRAECPTLLTTAVGSGDRSLLRAPTPSEFMKARARQLVMIARENAWTDEQLAGQILDEVYAVDGLRGTEDRALRAALKEVAAGPHVLDCVACVARNTLARVLRESVEGEQRT